MDESNVIPRGDGRDVILQAFHWNLVKTAGTGTLDGGDRSWYAVLAEMAPRIAEIGVSVAYLPPPWRDDSYWERDGQHGGGEGYFWHDFDLNSRYGTKTELTSLVRRLEDSGVRAIVDLVANHRDRQRMQADPWPFPGPHWRDGGEDCGGAFLDGSFDLNLSHPEVQSRFIRALEELMRDCGVCGWRWDFVWGYDVELVLRWIQLTHLDEYLSIGEYWQGSADNPGDPLVARYGPDERARILGWARDAGSLAYDLILKREINTANPAHLKYGLNASGSPEERRLMMTFVDNHDTGASPWSSANGWGQQHWPCPDHFKHAAYAFILSMPGTPCLYWPDVFDWGFEADVRALVAARRRAGVWAGSDWIDLTDRHSGFAAIVKNEADEEALAVSIGSDWTGPGAGWQLAHARSGEYAVWVKG